MGEMFSGGLSGGSDGIDVDLKFDIQKAMKKLKVSESIASRAASASINDALKRGQTHSRRSMSKRLGVKQKYIRKAFWIVRASRKKLSGALKVRQVAIRLEWIGGRQLKAGFRPRGMKVRKGTFRQTMKSGHKGVFKREGSNRLPIKTAYAGNMYHEFDKDDARDALRDVSHETLVKRMKYHINRIVTRNGLRR